jgi:hypothetical protein
LADWLFDAYDLCCFSGRLQVGYFCPTKKDKNGSFAGLREAVPKVKLDGLNEIRGIGGRLASRSV